MNVLMSISLISVDPVLRCPVCKKSFTQENVIDNMFICEAVPVAGPAVQTYVCTSCSDDEVGSVFCMDCAEWLCEVCLQVCAISNAFQYYDVFRYRVAGSYH